MIRIFRKIIYSLSALALVIGCTVQPTLPSTEIDDPPTSHIAAPTLTETGQPLAVESEGVDFPLSEEDEDRILFENGVTDQNLSVPIVRADSFESLIGSEFMDKSITDVMNITIRLVNQGYQKIEIPQYAEAIIESIQSKRPDVEIIIRQTDEEGNVIPTPDDYFSVVTFGYAAGGYENKVKNPDGLWLERDGSGNYVPIAAQLAYGEDAVYVKLPDAVGSKLVQVTGWVKIVAIEQRGAAPDEWGRWNLLPGITEATLEAPERGVHDVTALIEAMQNAGQGEIVLDPDRDYDGQVEIDPAAAKEYYDYLLNAIVMANREYFKLLTEQSGMQFQSGEDLINYLSENDWILPLIDGKCIKLIQGVRENVSGVKRSWYLDKPVSLKNIGLMFFKYHEAQEVFSTYDANPVIKSGRTVLLVHGIVGKYDWVGLGFGTHTVTGEQGDYYNLSIQISQNEEGPISGFPENGVLGSEDLAYLNDYITFVAYIFRAFRPPVDAVKYIMDMGGHACYQNSGCVNNDGVVDSIGIDSVDGVYGRYSQAKDKPPNILIPAQK